MTAHVRRALALFMAGFACLTATRADDSNLRQTPIVRAVQKTRGGIVAVRIEKATPGNGVKDCIGTGVIIDERGYLVTSEHLTRDAGRIRVQLADGSEWDARVVTEDPTADVAVLRIKTDRKLQPLPLGSGHDLLVGETVVAVGHPYGCGYTVSQGIISALGQQVTMPSGPRLTGLIQTDASINPGNSGGPLLNINGDWIGLTVAMRENARGISYALNIDTVTQLLGRKLDARHVAGIDHGLKCEDRKTAADSSNTRVVIAAVLDKSSAHGAGLLSGDEIVTINGSPIANAFDVERALWDRAPGDRLTATIIRDGDRRTIEWLATPARDATPTVMKDRGRSSGGRN